MTDPQNDIPCTACETEGSRSRLDDDGLCPDCRTPAGRLVAALRERCLNDAVVAYRWSITVAGMDAEADDQHWTIGGTPEHEWRTGYDVTIPAAADALAAIVQAPGLRAERDTLAARVAALEEHNARMVAQLLALADGFDEADKVYGEWSKAARHVIDAFPGHDWPDIRDALRDLAGGAS
jgi:hypothetical protein